MGDLECYLTHCYDLVLQADHVHVDDDAELCACANLIEHEDSKQQPQEKKYA
jgi:hypothetical protein